MDSCSSILVVKFFRTATGELVARATDPQTRESWTVGQAAPLWRLLYDAPTAVLPLREETTN